MKQWIIGLHDAFSKPKRKIKKKHGLKNLLHFPKKKSFILGWMMTKHKIQMLLILQDGWWPSVKQKYFLYSIYFRMDTDLVYLANFPNPSMK